MTDSSRPQGMRAFLVVWVGQLVSLLGSGMTGFGITIWVFGQTGRATDLTLLAFFFLTPMLIMSPIAGVLVDRHNRRLMMMLSDLAAGLTTVAILVLLALGELQIWHFYITNVISGAFQAFQWPAFSAAISLMLDKKDYTRASSLQSLAQSGSGMLTPLLAGALLPLLGLQGLLLLDVVTFVFAVVSLLVVHIPEIDPAERQQEAEVTFLSDATFGFRFILKNRPLLWVQTVFLVGNFFISIGLALQAAMILASTGNNEFVLGLTQTIGAAGAVLGGVIVSAWGGFKRNIHGVLLGWAGAGIFFALMAFGTPEPLWLGVLIWGGAQFLAAMFSPLINGSNQAIWQSKVPPELQGRVFSIRMLIAWLVLPLARLIAGPLADGVFEPAMLADGALAPIFGSLLRTGPGAGMSLMIFLTGIITAFAGLGGYLLPLVRNVEDLLPDHEATGEAAAPAVDEADPAPEPA